MQACLPVRRESQVRAQSCTCAWPGPPSPRLRPPGCGHSLPPPQRGRLPCVCMQVASHGCGHLVAATPTWPRSSRHLTRRARVVAATPAHAGHPAPWSRPQWLRPGHAGMWPPMHPHSHARAWPRRGAADPLRECMPPGGPLAGKDPLSLVCCARKAGPDQAVGAHVFGECWILFSIACLLKGDSKHGWAAPQKFRSWRTNWCPLPCVMPGQ